jgi:membrane protease YdiL (CAAX protease family)
MKHKSTVLEISAVYAVILLIVAFTSDIVSLGGSVPVKMLLTVGASAVMAAVPLAVCRIRKISLSALGFSRNKAGLQLLLSFGVFAVTISAAVLIPLFIGLNKTDVLSFKSSSIGVLVFYILFDIICVGFGEEFVFRGYMYTRVKTASGSDWGAIAVSSVLFGLLHFPNTLNVLNVVCTAALGFVYAFCRYKLKNCTVLTLSVAHGLHDAAITLLSYILL